MSSIGTPLYEKLARLIGEPTARTRFRKTKDITIRPPPDLTVNVDR